MRRPPLVDPVLLRAFVTAARTGSLSATARELHLTQGAISQQIKRLEVFYGCTLLNRHPHGIALTAKGVELLDGASQLLDLNDRLHDTLKGSDTLGTVRVGVPHDLAGAPFVPVLSAYVQRYPTVDVAIVTGSSVELMQQFARGQVDVTLNQCLAPDVTGDPLCVEPLVWVSAERALCTQRPLPLCFVTPTCTFRRLATGLLAEASIPWRVVFENASVEATLATVGSGLAVTPWLSALVPHGLEVVGPHAGLPTLPAITLELHFASSASRAARAMAQVIREQYGEGTWHR